MYNQSGHTAVTFLVALLLGIFGTLFVIKSQTANLLVKEIESPYSFEETLTTLEANAKALGWKVPSKWKANFQANFRKIVGTDIGPMQLLKMCEPQIAADLLQADENKYLSVMMPCTFAVYEKSDGKTYIAMMNLGVVGQAITHPHPLAAVEAEDIPVAGRVRGSGPARRRGREGIGELGSRYRSGQDGSEC